jgi:quercetin dioxygenase-like cupin family protein
MSSGNERGSRVAGTKGQIFLTWRETDEWEEVPELKLRYRSVSFGAEGQETRAVMVRYEPGSEVPVHYHPSDYCSIVVDGSIEITRRTHEVGSVRLVKGGTAYGPLRVGDDGCTVIDIFAAGEQGVTYLPK